MRRPRFAKKNGPKTSWESVSDWYGAHARQTTSLLQEVVFPSAMKLLAPEAGKQYLDIACGEGSFSRLLMKERRCRVTGLDASPSLIEQAKRKAAKQGTYLVADARAFGKSVPAGSFDGASCILAVQNINPAAPVFQGAAAALKPGAPFVIVMNHPCFRQPRQSGWGWDEERKLQYRRVDRYLTPYEIPIQAHPGSAPHLKTLSYHRPLQDYIRELAAAGFVVEAIEEWVSNRTSSYGSHAKAENAARTEIPMFMAIRALRR